MERRQTCRGEDYYYCPGCRVAGPIFHNPGEVESWCIGCGMTTVHKATYLTGTEKEWSELICKVCGQKMNIPSKQMETENGIGEPRKR
jgi:hypothetical protein